MSTSPTELSRARKAALVVQYLLNDGQELPLADLPEDSQLRLSRELGALGLVDRATMDSVAREFAEALGNLAMTVPGSVEAALAGLDGKISPKALQKLRDEAASRAGADPWAQVRALDPDDLVPVLEAESPEIGAVLLSKLPTARAAELLGRLPGDRARRIAHAVARTADIRPEAVARIGEALAGQYCGTHAPAFPQTPGQRVGAILNASTTETRERLLHDLGTQDPDFAESVRQSIFTFADIPARLAPLDVPGVIRDVPDAELGKALGSAQAAGGPLAAAADHILSNMSQRMADSLREDVEELGKIRKSEAEAAQAVVVATIRAAADSGTITLIDPEEEEED
ncbi:FliG C-terminal domain-containing protein [Salibaculum sp.]|uniref:FliG C-terminal domain-containing protein n=1 Tax=Salibaculum sp. TaxID=2855480 RepID=UPI002B46D1DE|nr:FliG C-terminal domain-containing protein [Salibaculum sp.]HKL68404.1 FliG C-terminal domain-containing protein [Salibaculum sp.]